MQIQDGKITSFLSSRTDIDHSNVQVTVLEEGLTEIRFPSSLHIYVPVQVSVQGKGYASSEWVQQQSVLMVQTYDETGTPKTLDLNVQVSNMGQ